MLSVVSLAVAACGLVLAISLAVCYYRLRTHWQVQPAAVNVSWLLPLGVPFRHSFSGLARWRQYRAGIYVLISSPCVGTWRLRRHLAETKGEQAGLMGGVGVRWLWLDIGAPSGGMLLRNDWAATKQSYQLFDG